MEYVKIRTIEDVFKVVTVDNVDVFMKDFAGILNAYLLVVELAKAKGLENEIEFPKEFDWSDDGEHRISVDLLDKIDK